jgi:hypothetical protein
MSAILAGRNHSNSSVLKLIPSKTPDLASSQGKEHIYYWSHIAILLYGHQIIGSETGDWGNHKGAGGKT